MCAKLGVVTHAYNPNTWETEGKRLAKDGTQKAQPISIPDNNNKTRKPTETGRPDV